MHQFVIFVILMAYGLLLFELVFLHVPSVASVYQLVWSKNSIINYNNEKLESGRLYEILKWPLLKKMLLLALPTFISIIAGCLPLVYLMFILLKTFSWQDLNNFYLIQNIAGIAFIVAGRVFTIYATLEIRKENQQKEKSFDLKTNGVFGLSRNPLLVGMYVMYLGMFIIFPDIFFAAGLIVYFSNMHFRILLEEDFLEFQFGKPFIMYKQRVKRYI
jgi:protein-S-isoprenylcysteine O-methyltransferase Ste14